MGEYELTALIAISLIVLIGVLGVVWFVRRRVSTVSINAGGVKAKVQAHKPQTTTVSNVQQFSEEGSNDAKVKSSVANVNGVFQQAKCDNNLSIGND